MGYSTVLGHMVLFTFILIAISFLIGEVNDYFTDTTKDVEYQQENLKEQLWTEISLTTVTYDSTDYYIYANNTGKTTLETDCMDVFVDREFIPESNYSITILDTDFDPTLWNPDERIEIDAWWSPQTGTREIKAVTCNGVSDSKLVTVS
jgi:archaellum component FlaF (FlaF/FlaG flagellin family)